MGNLVFAEADYKQALALSPLDEGANLRMGVLQEKLGFCQQQQRCTTGRREKGVAGRAWLRAVLAGERVHQKLELSFGQRIYSHLHHKKEI